MRSLLESLHRAPVLVLCLVLAMAQRPAARSLRAAEDEPAAKPPEMPAAERKLLDAFRAQQERDTPTEQEQQEMTAESERLLRRLMKDLPRSPGAEDAAHELVNLLLRQGRLEDAIAAWKEYGSGLETSEPTERNAAQRALAAMRRCEEAGDLEGARKNCAVVLATQLTDPNAQVLTTIRVLNQLSRLALGLDDYKGAAAAARWALELVQKHPEEAAGEMDANQPGPASIRKPGRYWVGEGPLARREEIRYARQAWSSQEQTCPPAGYLSVTRSLPCRSTD